MDASVLVARCTKALAPGDDEGPTTLISEPCDATWTMSSIAELAPCGPQAVMICVPWYETWFGAAAARSSHDTASGESSWSIAGTAAAGSGRPIPIRAVLTRTASRFRLTDQRPVRATGCSVELNPTYPDPLYELST